MLVKGGSDLADKVVNYYSRSLFDLGCPVNQGQVLTWTFDGPKHLEIYTEQAGLEKFGACFVDYLYVLQPVEDSHQMIGKYMSNFDGKCFFSCRLENVIASTPAVFVYLSLP